MVMLPACLIVAAAFAAVLRNWRMLGTASILLANWAINTAVCHWTGQAYPWSWFVSVDYLSGLVLLIMAGKPSMWQAIVTALFALECIAHGAFGVTKESPWTEYYYWYTLHYVAWSQFWIVVSWGLCEVAGRRIRAARGKASVIVGMERNQPPRAEP